MADGRDRPTGLTVYGAHWCPDCRRSKQFLGEHQIPYRWVDIEQDKAGEAYVLAKNDGRRIIPTIEFEDGAILVEPSNAELAAKLGLRTRVDRNHYDLVVVGGGPAGLTTALYAAREGIDTLVIERAALGGQSAATERLDNFPGFPEGIEGAEFAGRLRRQAERFGVTMLQAQDVTAVSRRDNYRVVRTGDGAEYTGRALVLATGSRYRRLGVPGEDGLVGAGIHFCATCDGPFYRDRPVAVIGGGNSATEESLFLVKFVERVTLLVRDGSLRASQVIQDKMRAHGQIDLRFHRQVVEFRGAGGKLAAVLVKNTANGETEELHPAGVFVFIGQTPNTGFLAGSGVRLNRWGFVTTGHDLSHDGDEDAGPVAFEGRRPALLETSVPGVFAAGDVRADSTKQVASAAGEGATAALLVRDYLRRT